MVMMMKLIYIFGHVLARFKIKRSVVAMAVAT